MLSKINDRVIFLLCCLLLLVTSFVVQFTAWPEMLVYPYLLNNGFLLYKDLIAPYTPIFLWFLQNFEALMGYSPEILRALTLALAFINLLLVGKIAELVWPKVKNAKIVSYIFYSFWFFYFEGNGLWFEIFQTPIILGSLYFLYKHFFVSKISKDYILGLVLLSISFFAKQSALWIIFAVGFFVLLNYAKDIKKLSSYFLFSIAPFLFTFLITLLIAWMGGYIFEYWYWAFEYTFFILPFNSDYQGYPALRQLAQFAIPLSTVLPTVILFRKDLNKLLFLLLFLAGSFMSVLPRWEWFHLQPFLGVLSIISSAGLLTIYSSKNILVKSGVFIMIVLCLGLVGREMLTHLNKPVRFFEQDTYKLSQELSQISCNSLLIFNSHDQLYVLNNQLPAVKPYAQNFASFLEVEGVQEKIIAEMDKNQVECIVFSPYSGRGGYEAGDYRPQKFGDYIDRNYYEDMQLTKNTKLLRLKL